MYLFELEFSSFLDRCPGVGLLDHMVTLVLVLFLFLINLFIYFRPCWVFVAACRLFFSSCGERGLLFVCSVQSSHCSGFSCCGVWAVGHAGFSSCGVQAQ